jgi:hypothetical protein
LALLDDADTPDGVDAELDTSEEMGKMLKKIAVRILHSEYTLL